MILQTTVEQVDDGHDESAAPIYSADSRCDKIAERSGLMP
jgi:hypothetical protein